MNKDINTVIEKEMCKYCRYNVATNACKFDPYTECTEYGKKFFDSDYFKNKYVKEENK